MVKEEFLPQFSVRKIRWDEPEYLPEIKVDRISLLRIFRNLVDNCLKYGGDNLSEIKIGFKESDKFHIFSVKDDGVGIKSEVSKKSLDYLTDKKPQKGLKVPGWD
ncbi:MAG: ATP-binding protein [Thermodesulfobacteriota bacterium]|jgi:light-regulated signal transduction histidine kinase (bacteriophytochrome)|nr:MAG: ATP-binding protein [Thermodesulfobacteriota bacterium]